MARYDDLTWWMNRPAGMTDETAVRTYGTLSPLAGALAQTAAIDYGPDQGIGTGPGRKLVLKDPEAIARTAAQVAALQPQGNPWAGRVMGDTIGGAQSNWLSRRGQDLSAIAAARAFQEQQRQFNLTTQERAQARRDQLEAANWARNLNSQMRQAEVDQRAQDSMLDYLSSLARTDTQSRDAAQRLAQQNWLTSARASAAMPQNDGQLGELLRAQAELKAALADTQDEYDSLGEIDRSSFLPSGVAGPVPYNQDLTEQLSQLRRAALLNEADIQSAKAAPKRSAVMLPATPYPTVQGGIDPSILTSLLAVQQSPRVTSPALTPTQRLLMERGNILGPGSWRGDYSAPAPYSTMRLPRGDSPTYQSPAPSPSVASDPQVTLRLTPDGRLVPVPSPTLASFID